MVAAGAWDECRANDEASGTEWLRDSRSGSTDRYLCFQFCFVGVTTLMSSGDQGKGLRGARTGMGTSHVRDFQRSFVRTSAGGTWFWRG